MGGRAKTGHFMPFRAKAARRFGSSGGEGQAGADGGSRAGMRGAGDRMADSLT
jgi:hypothetical protein